jgi:hypothetical protein
MMLLSTEKVWVYAYDGISQRHTCLLSKFDMDSKTPPMEFLQVYEPVATSLIGLGDYRGAVKLLEQMVLLETTLPEDRSRRLMSQHVLAQVYQTNGLIEQAVQLLEQVVRIKVTTLAEDNPNRLISQHVLTIMYKEKDVMMAQKSHNEV